MTRRGALRALAALLAAPLLRACVLPVEPAGWACADGMAPEPDAAEGWGDVLASDHAASDRSGPRLGK